MKNIPETKDPVVIRTDVSDQETRERICFVISQPGDVLYAKVEFIDERAYEGLTKDQLRNLIPEDYVHSFIMVVDSMAITDVDHPLLILDLLEDGEFSSVPTQIVGTENNLSTADMDFQKLANAADKTGIFRGFIEG